jgi:hypothetical protein
VAYFRNTIAASGKWVIQTAGKFVRVMSAGAAVDVSLYRNGSLVAIVENVRGGLWRRGAFDRVEIQNKVAAANDVEIVTDDDEMGYDSFTIAGQQGAFTQAAATVTNSSAQLVAANTARRYLLIQNKDASGDIFLNLAGVAATTANGIKVPAGGSLELAGYCPTAAVFAIGSIASNANIVVAEG